MGLENCNRCMSQLKSNIQGSPSTNAGLWQLKVLTLELEVSPDILTSVSAGCTQRMWRHDIRACTLVLGVSP